MSHFDSAVDFVLQNEGGWANHKKDPGGPTKYGISLRWLRTIGDMDEDGFHDGDVDSDGDVDWEDVAALSVDAAKEYYRTYWWDRFDYDRIDRFLLAQKVFDLAVNMGPGRAHKIVQRGLNQILPLDDRLDEDGKLGPKTIAALNRQDLDEHRVLRAIGDSAARFYRSLNRPEFISGWLKRAYA